MIYCGVGEPNITPDSQLGISSESLELRSILKEKADSFYKQYHYMGGVSSGAHYGIYDNGNLIAVATRGAVMSRYIQSLLFGVNNNIKLCELSRLCCIPNWRPLSKVVALFIKECKKDSYDAILSYADIGQNHRGIIYQATNFAYTGIAEPAGHLRWFIDGKEISPRTFYSRYGTASRDVVIANNPGIVSKKRTRKHRYLLPISRKARKLLLVKLPYPKLDVIYKSSR